MNSVHMIKVDRFVKVKRGCDKITASFNKESGERAFSQRPIIYKSRNSKKELVHK